MAPRRRIFAPVREHIFAMEAKTGKLIDSFGTGGAIELSKDLDRDVDAGEMIVSRTPPAVYGDLLIVMSGRVRDRRSHRRDISARTTARPASVAGSSIRFRIQANSAMRHGQRIRGRPAAVRTAGAA